MLDGQQIEKRWRKGGKPRKRNVMDECVFVCLCERGEWYTEGEVCEGAIKALYYKSLTVHVCV